MFIIDFDDTLFDTHAFKQAREQALLRLGISRELYQVSYATARTLVDGTFVYSSPHHARVLSDQGFDQKVVETALRQVDDQVANFLFPDTREFLTRLQSTGRPLFLLSLGEKNFQEMKLQACGIFHFFEKVFVVNKNKVEVVSELLLAHPETKNVYFINDKVQESLDLQARFPILSIILKQSDSIPLAEYQKSGLPFFAHLVDILPTIL